MVNRISATIIADSKNSFGHRITTYVLVFPRIILAEFNTHRMISKNSASSRAIPFKVLYNKVQNEPFIPIAWQKEHKGMQGTEYFDAEESQVNEVVWLQARDSALENALQLHDFEITKQLCNRLLEPFLYHTVICTGTDWENFFALRAHPAAEIHIADLAEKMLLAYNESTPKRLQPGEWHIPFGDTLDNFRIQALGENPYTYEKGQEYRVKIATARCARVSYLNFEGKDDYEADIKLHDMLLQAGHMSPFEHCARAMVSYEYCGNFKGFVQYRKTLTGENKTDERVIK